MSIWCNRIPNVSHSLSQPTFFKHLVTSTVTTSSTCRAPRRKTLTTSASLTSPHLETLTSHQKDQISLYVDALLQWNQRMNLTAVTETSEVMKRHVDDSLAIISPIRNSYLSHCSSSCENLKLVDVGSGPGLPGLILAIACPSWKVTLLESMNKRCIFLKHAISVTGLSNVEVLRARAEPLKQMRVGLKVLSTSGESVEYATWGSQIITTLNTRDDQYLHLSFCQEKSGQGKLAGHFLPITSVGQSLDLRELFDVAVARAVAEMRVLAEYCLPLVRVGGLFVAAKGHDPQEEVKNAERAIQLLGASVLQLCPVESHSPYGQRTAVVCLKDRPTPRKYPRDPGTPAKVPL